MKNKLNLKKYIIYLVSFFTCIFCFFRYANAAETEKNILFISSYTESFITVPEQIAGIKSVLTPDKVNLDIEYMDAKRLDTEENKDLFYNHLKYKLQNLKAYDAVIVGDDTALQFAMDYQKSLFKNMPVIFLGINDFDRARIANNREWFTGVVEATSLKENIIIAQKFNPEAKKVVAIVDNTATGKGDKGQFYELKEDFKNLEFEDINVSDYTFEELKGTLENIGKDTILLYLSMFQDSTGRVISIDEAVKILKEHTVVPIYRASIGGVGEGLLGGKMVSYSEQGKIAAEMALKAANGTPVKDIKVIWESPNKYIFDYNIIKKYHIDKRLIPKEAELINKNPTFFQQYRNVTIAALIIIGSLLFGFIVMILDNIKRRAIEKALNESHEELSAIYEELAASDEELKAQYEEIQEYTENLERLQQKYEIAISSTDSAVWEMNVETKEVYFSMGISNITGADIKDKLDVRKLLKEYVLPEDKEILRKEYYGFIKDTRKEINFPIRIMDRSGSIKWLLVRGKGILDSGRNLRSINGILLDITKIKEQEEYIQHLAYHDVLTGLPNRLYFIDKLKEELSGDRPGAVMILDLDNFKDINDIFGHAYGDMVLKEVASRLDSIMGTKVLISRFGGDEFLLFVSDLEDAKVIESYGEMINRVLGEVVILQGKEVYVTHSLGISQYPKDSTDVDQLIMNADTAMYRAKNSGKNKYMFFDSSMMEKLKEKASIELILRHALANNGLLLVYQPQVDTVTGKIVGFEALLRLKEHNIPPNAFIGVAEEVGLINEIGRWVTQEAICQMARWRDKGLTLKPVAINFSAKQLRDEKYLSFLEEVLKKASIDPKYVEIEITEGILMERTEETVAFLDKLKSKGVKIALDDFGVGYSSLSYLTFIPVDKIKLDKSLNDRFLELENIKVMDSLISLAHGLNLKVTAEGIEKIDQYKRLKVGQCDYIQGYLFSKPMKVEEIEKIYDADLFNINNIP